MIGIGYDKKQFRMLCLLDIRGYIWTGKKHFCFPVYLVATEASFVSANVTNCAVRYGTLLKCPTISLDIVQQTCFTKYRNEGQKTSLIERIRTVGKIYGLFGLQKQLCDYKIVISICIAPNFKSFKGTSLVSHH